MVSEMSVFGGSKSIPKTKGPTKAYSIRIVNPVARIKDSHLINLPIE